MYADVPNFSNFFAVHPKYVRINLLATTKEEVVNHLEQDEWEKVETPATYNRFLKRTAKLTEPHFMEDFHYDDLLVFPNKTPLYMHCLYDNGSLVLQAKVCSNTIILQDKI
jgi:16S rRNA C967 or C1407 C5-methylase (RsmB/RsmF family)